MSGRSLWLGTDDLVRTIAASLGILAGVLFIIRRPSRRSGSLSSSAIALPSVIVGSVLVARAYGAPIPPIAWVCIAIGGLFSGWAIASLGRSFAIFPSARNVVAHGPFRWIRHPAYTGQLVMLVGVMVVQRGHWIDLLLFVMAAVWMGARAVVEERLLMNDPIYVAYADRVRWRVLPGVW